MSPTIEVSDSLRILIAASFEPGGLRHLAAIQDARRPASFRVGRWTSRASKSWPSSSSAAASRLSAGGVVTLGRQCDRRSRDHEGIRGAT